MKADYKRRIFVFLTLLLMVIFIFGMSRLNIAFTKGMEGETAPQFILDEIYGKKVKLSNYRGKIVILDFFTTWCPPCIKEIPHFVSLYKKYEKKGLVILGACMNAQDMKKIKDFIKENKINYPVLKADEKVKKDYGGVKYIPTTFVIDKKGDIFRKYVGYHSEETFEKDILTLLKKNK